MTDNFRVPDYVEPILGWRSWTTSSKNTVLQSVVRVNVQWPTNQYLTANCMLHTHARAEPSPVEHCTCGIYAALDIPKAMDYANSGRFTGSGELSAFGIVSLWGKVVEHGRGWRSQYAYPRLLILIPPARVSREDIIDAEWYAIQLGMMHMQTIKTYRTAERLQAAYGVPTYLGPTNESAELSKTKLDGILSDMRFQLARRRTLESVGRLTPSDVDLFEDRLARVHNLTRIQP